MPTFVMLVRVAPPGKKDLEATLRGWGKLTKAFEKDGGRITTYACMGPYDLVSILRAPSDPVALRFLASVTLDGRFEADTSNAQRYRPVPRGEAKPHR